MNQAILIERVGRKIEVLPVKLYHFEPWIRRGLMPYA